MARRILRVAIIALTGVGLAISSGVSANAYSAGYSNWTSVPSVYKGTQGDLVGLWQSVLWSEHYMSKCLSEYPNNAIDGYFGQVTHNKSEQWQTRYGLASDGVIGSASWSKAYSRTYPADQFGDTRSAGFRVYDAGAGSTRVVWTHRWLSSDSGWWEPRGEWHYYNPANPGQSFLPRFVRNDFNFYTC